MREVLQEPGNGPVLRKLLITAVAMLVVPMSAFFAMRTVLGDLLGLDASLGARNMWGGIVAAVSVNVIIILYVWLAFAEDAAPGASFVGKKTE